MVYVSCKFYQPRTTKWLSKTFRRKGVCDSDLFLKHPTKNLWKIVGRLNDVMVIASGEKTVPGTMENVINSSPLSRGAVMFGRDGNQVGILVEPRPEHIIDTRDNVAVTDFRNKIWNARLAAA